MESTALDQLHHLASLPDMLFAAGFPDLHPGKGIPNGAAAVSQKQIYPHLIGNDVGCGMALFDTDLPRRKVKLDRLAQKLAGLELTPDGDLRPWIERFRLEPASLSAAFGTIGGGNHFAELLVVEDLRQPEHFTIAGLQPDHCLLLVHSGSRSLGEQVLRSHTDHFGAKGLDVAGEEAQAYLTEHDHAVRWAQANRDLLGHRFLQGIRAHGEALVNTPHNSISRETLTDGACWIHRKGAASTRTPLVIIPGTRGSWTYLVAPTGPQDANAYSVAHGAGRKWKRTECRGRLNRNYRASDLTRTKLKSRVICEDRDLLYEEAPEAYKDITRVISDLEAFGLVEVVATLRPLLTYKTRRTER